MQNEGRLSSVTNSMRLLKCFSAREREIGLVELGRRIGLARSSAHRLASTLVGEGMLEQNPATGKYRLGLTAFELGSLARARMDIYNEAKDVLHDLREKTHETINLAILRDGDVIYLNSLESRTAVRATTPVGQRLPAGDRAEGMVLLAYQQGAADTLADIRARGHAIGNEQAEIGVRAIAAPFFGAEDEVLGAIGIAAPAQRVGRRALAAFLPLLLDATATLSARLGADVAHMREAR